MRNLLPSAKLEHKPFNLVGSLRLVIVVVGLGLAPVALAVANPQAGSVGLTGTIPGPPPTSTATIVLPPNGFVTATIPITVSGTCTSADFVTIMDNNALAGATTCPSNGAYSLQINLFVGTNVLGAEISDVLGQAGPVSRTVTVYYTPPNESVGGAAAGKQLFLQSNTGVVAGSPGDNITRSVTIVGGVAPFAMNWQWGDGTSTLESVAADGQVTASHAYTRPGDYTVIVRATDSQGNSAIMQFVTVVNGPTQGYGATRGLGLGAVSGVLIGSWPLFGLAAIVVAAFWLGEQRMLRKVRRKLAGL